MALNNTFTQGSRGVRHTSDNVSTNTRVNRIVNQLESLEEDEDDQFEIMKV